MLRHGHDHDLHRRNTRGQHKTVIVAVGHDKTADYARRHTPRGLIGVLLLIVLIRKGNVKLLGKALTEEVAGAGLERLLIVHHALDGVGVDRARKLLLVGLVAADNGHCQIVLAEVCVNLKLLQGLLARLLLGRVQGMTLLPEKFSAAQEGAGGLLPAEHGAPLVI